MFVFLVCYKFPDSLTFLFCLEWHRGAVVYIYANAAAPNGRFRLVRRADNFGPTYWILESELDVEELPLQNFDKVLE